MDTQDIKSGVRKMDIYENAIKLNDKDFKEIIGVKRSTFDSMVNILSGFRGETQKMERRAKKETFNRRTAHTDIEILPVLRHAESACI